MEQNCSVLKMPTYFKTAVCLCRIYLMDRQCTACKNRMLFTAFIFSLILFDSVFRHRIIFLWTTGCFKLTAYVYYLNCVKYIQALPLGINYFSASYSQKKPILNSICLIFSIKEDTYRLSHNYILRLCFKSEYFKDLGYTIYFSELHPI